MLRSLPALRVFAFVVLFACRTPPAGAPTPELLAPVAVKAAEGLVAQGPYTLVAAGGAPEQVPFEQCLKRVCAPEFGSRCDGARLAGEHGLLSATAAGARWTVRGGALSDGRLEGAPVVLFRAECADGARALIRVETQGGGAGVFADAESFGGRWRLLRTFGAFGTR